MFYLAPMLIMPIMFVPRFTSSGAQPHRSIADFKSLENFAFDGAAPSDGGAVGGASSGVLFRGHGEARQFRHALVQTDEAGAEYVMCNYRHRNF